MRDCTDRHCGNNPNRKVNRNDYDSVMGFLCDACEDALRDPECPICGYPKSDHADELLMCREAEDVDDDEHERMILLAALVAEDGRTRWTP